MVTICDVPSTVQETTHSPQVLIFLSRFDSAERKISKFQTQLKFS